MHSNVKVRLPSPGPGSKTQPNSPPRAKLKLIFRDGFHRAYTELFNLVENRRKARIAAGPGSHLSLEIKLENENNYLDKLKDNLCSGKLTILCNFGLGLDSVHGVRFKYVMSKSRS